MVQGMRSALGCGATGGSSCACRPRARCGCSVMRNMLAVLALQYCAVFWNAQARALRCRGKGCGRSRGGGELHWKEVECGWVNDNAGVQGQCGRGEEVHPANAEPRLHWRINGIVWLFKPH